MILPNKLINFSDSILAKTISIISQINNQSLNIQNLYVKCRNDFEEIDEFIIALDILIILGKVKYNSENGVVEYVENNLL